MTTYISLTYSSDLKDNAGTSFQFVILTCQSTINVERFTRYLSFHAIQTTFERQINERFIDFLIFKIYFYFIISFRSMIHGVCVCMGVCRTKVIIIIIIICFCLIHFIYFNHINYTNLKTFNFCPFFKVNRRFNPFISLTCGHILVLLPSKLRFYFLLFSVQSYSAIHNTYLCE